MMEPDQLLHAVARAALVGIVALPAARLVLPLLAVKRFRPVVLAAVLVPWFTPSLLTGYAWSGAAVSLTNIPGAATLFYCLILVLKFAPAAILTLHLVRSPVSREAIHCHTLLRPPCSHPVRHTAFLLGSGAVVPYVAAWLLVFLFAFAEFELASLMSIPSWTVAVFDAHAGGIPVSHSFRLVLIPLVAQILVVLTAFRVAACGRFVSEDDTETSSRISRPASIGAIACLGIAVAVVSLIPFCLVVRDVIAGITLLGQAFQLAGQLGVSMAVAALAAIAAVWWCMLFRKRPAIATMGFAGLAGPLALSLGAAWLITRNPLILIRETPLPLITVLAVLALPIAFIAVRLAARDDRVAAIHTARLLRPRAASDDIVWELRMRAPFWTTVLLFIWVYWDLTASSILAPIGMTPVSVRLYNLMHYGHTAGLSGMVLLAILAPVVAIALAFGAARIIHIAWHKHG
jgi:ABC-type Fe3+ transport system permease subunit